MKPLREKSTRFFVIFLYLSLYATSALLIINATQYRQKGPVPGDVTHISAVSVCVDGGPWQSLTLPHTFRGLAPGTEVAVKTMITPRSNDCVFLKTVFSPARVSLGGTPVLALGEPGSHPACMTDPPSDIRLVDTNGSGEETELLVEYRAPEACRNLLISPYMLGSAKSIMFVMAKQLGLTMVLSLVQVIMGCVMLVVALCLMVLDHKGQVFFWLGLSSKFAGIWFLCQNDFSIMIFKGTSLLYMLTFIGFFSFIVPLLRFYRVAVGFRNPLPLSLLEGISAVAAITAILLQATGVLSFPASMRFFRFSIPVTLLLATLLIFRESVTYRNRQTVRHLLPIGILTISAFLELFHDHMYSGYAFCYNFQIGMFLFLFLISILAGLSVRDSISLRKQEELLGKERHILEIQTQEQRANSLHLAMREQEMSRQRHDLRHHLAAIQELSQDNEPLQQYLSALLEKIPGRKERYCENQVVNAIVSHYVSCCEQENIRFESRLVVPETGSQATDGNLCAIFANLLENAVEACGRMETGDRFVRIGSSLQGDMLTVVMDNSFNGKLNRVGDRFRSSKRDDYGIGLSSVQSIAEAAGGGVEFGGKGTVFSSSVYLCIN